MGDLYSLMYWTLSDTVGGAKGVTTALIILCVLIGLVRYIRLQSQP